eukprot:1156395-Pelagomonas_calceolata.AAC.3
MEGSPAAALVGPPAVPCMQFCCSCTGQWSHLTLIGNAARSLFTSVCVCVKKRVQGLTFGRLVAQGPPGWHGKH